MTNELYHHGVKGMHWHIRKGSVKATGGKSKPKIRDPKTMSDEELRKRVNRLQMEQQYRTLSSADISSGRKYAKKFMKSATTAAAVTTTAITIYNNAGKIKDIIEKVAHK